MVLNPQEIKESNRTKQHRQRTPESPDSCTSGEVIGEIGEMKDWVGLSLENFSQQAHPNYLQQFHLVISNHMAATRDW